MQLIVESPRVQVNSTLQQMIVHKTLSLEKLYNRITKCVVVLRKEKNDQAQWCRVDTKLAVPKKQLFASERADSFEAALQMVIEDLQRQLRKYKTERSEV